MNKIRNKSTRDALERLACLAYHYDKRGITSIGLDILYMARIGTISDEDVRQNSPRLKGQLKKFTDLLVDHGFIHRIANGYKAGVFRRPYRVNKTAILEAYGAETVSSYRQTVDDYLSYQKSPAAFISSMENIEFPSTQISDVTWSIVAPGKIEFRRGNRLIRRIAFRDEYGRQTFQTKTFFDIKEAMIAFVRSIRFEIPSDEIERKIAIINDGVPETYKVEFKVHFVIYWTSSGKSFVTQKTTRSYSPFCSYGRKNGEREETLKKEGLSRDFDIKSCVPRLTLYRNKGVWLPREIDLYERMFKAAGIARAWTPALRAHMKLAFFPIYFVNGLQKSWVAYYNSKKIRKEVGRENMFKETEYKKLFAVVRDIIGPSRGVKIFFEESLLEIEVLYRLRKTGRRVVNVFDGFYFGDDMSIDEVSATIDDAARDLFEKETA